LVIDRDEQVLSGWPIERLHSYLEAFSSRSSSLERTISSSTVVIVKSSRLCTGFVRRRSLLCARQDNSLSWSRAQGESRSCHAEDWRGTLARCDSNSNFQKATCFLRHLPMGYDFSHFLRRALLLRLRRQEANISAGGTQIVI